MDLSVSAMWEIKDGRRVRVAAVFFRLPVVPTPSGGRNHSATLPARAIALGWRGVVVGCGQISKDLRPQHEPQLERMPLRDRPVGPSRDGRPGQSERPCKSGSIASKSGKSLILRDDDLSIHAPRLNLFDRKSQEHLSCRRQYFLTWTE